MQIHYLYPKYYGNEHGAGDCIFDTNLISALRNIGNTVYEEPIPRKRKAIFSAPIWESKITGYSIDNNHLKNKRSEIIISHESLFATLKLFEEQSASIIVHNYFPRFSFKGRMDIEFLYKAGSIGYFERAFRKARHIFFLSKMDARQAEKDFPFIRGNYSILTPPAGKVPKAGRNLNHLHISGSDKWLPKRISNITMKTKEKLEKKDFLLLDFKESMKSGFGLITDRFSVGFKLKLMQMIYFGDIILTRSDVQEEIDYIAPNYKFIYRYSTEESLIELVSRLREELKDNEFAINLGEKFKDIEALTWESQAKLVMESFC